MLAGVFKAYYFLLFLPQETAVTVVVQKKVSSTVIQVNYPV